MTNHSNESTLAVQGFTPYAQVPRWILRSGDQLSHGAVRLYGVIMTYAGNETRTAFPGREKLAGDMGIKARSVSTYIKELEEFGALKVTRRRNKRTGNFYANHYVLVFQEPGAEYCTPPNAENHTITTPTVDLDPLLSTSDQRSNAHVARARSASAPINGRRYSPANPGDLTDDQRWMLIKKLQITGRRLLDGHRFYDEPTMRAWDDFYSTLDQACGETLWGDVLLDQIDNGKWTVSAKVADPYEAGAELNTMIHAAMKLAA